MHGKIVNSPPQPRLQCTKPMYWPPTLMNNSKRNLESICSTRTLPMPQQLPPPLPPAYIGHLLKGSHCQHRRPGAGKLPKYVCPSNSLRCDSAMSIPKGCPAWRAFRPTASDLLDAQYYVLKTFKSEISAQTSKKHSQLTVCEMQRRCLGRTAVSWWKNEKAVER